MAHRLDLVRRKARELASRHGEFKAPIAVERIARELGATVHYSPMDDELSGVIFVKDDKPFIGVNALHHRNRQRFTIAHELGHLVLHRELITRGVHVDKGFKVLRRDAVSSQGTDLVEVEANEFAGELLVPGPLLKTALARGEWDVDAELATELAKIFKVSPAMMQLRLLRSVTRGDGL